MKKMIKFFAFAAIAALAFVSCNKEIEVSVAPVEDGIKVAVVADMPMTKTALGEATASNIAIDWVNGVDKVGFFNHTADVNVQSSAVVVDGSGKATFTATVPSAGTYYAYYPYQNFTGDNAPSAEGVIVEISNNQRPSPTSFDPKADILVSTGFAATGETDTPASIQFKRVGAFMRIQFVDGTTGSKLSGEHANIVAIQIDTDGAPRLSAKYRLHGENGATYQSGWKKITASYDEGVFVLTGDGKYAFFGVKPQTFANAQRFFVTAETDHYSISKTITLPSEIVVNPGDMLPIKITLTDGDVIKNKLAKVWGNYGVAGVAGWPAYVAGAEGLDGALRNACFDDDYVYIPKTSGASTDGENFDEASVYMFNVSDGAYAGKVQRTTSPDYMAGTWASTHPVSCARMMKNTNPSVNGGKDILIVANLCDGTQQVRIYAWENGIASQPKLLSNFQGMANRRWGDRIWTEGTYQSGKIWFRNFYAVGTTAWLNVTNGVLSAEFLAKGAISVDEANNISDYKNFDPVSSNYGIVSTASGNGIHLISGTSVSKTYAGYKRCYGWEAFTYNAKNYLAYLDMSGGTNLPIVVVLEGDSDSLSNLEATLDAKNIVARAALATSNQNDFTTTGVYATSSVGDCIVRFIGGVPYILGMTRGGIALFRFEP